MMVQAQEEIGKGSANPTDPHHTPTINQPSISQPQKKQKSRKPKRKDTKVPPPSGPIDNVADEVVYEEMDDSLERAATTATSLDAEQDRGNINKTNPRQHLMNQVPLELVQRKDTQVPQPSDPTTNVADEAINEEIDDSLERAATTPTSLDAYSSSGPRRQETMGDTIAQTGFENVSKTSNDSLLAVVNTPQRINLVSTHFDADTDMFGVNDLEGDEVIVETKVDHEVVVETEVASKDVTLSVDEVTLAQALTALKSAKPKADKVMLQEPEQGTITTTFAITVIAVSTRPRAKGLVIHEHEQAPTPTVSLQQPSQLNVQDKGKGKMVEPEPVKKLSKKDQLMLDEELAFKLQAEEEEEEMLAKEKA
ncbi:hypothetical protein Tco_0652900 [Tanacetum coccineum]|uniref:Uncharacterized protein n=1 Tax=Tanacetum coccineum TaxID=301880 RepID=A0ABQ4WYX9_9ASTR